MPAECMVATPEATILRDVLETRRMPSAGFAAATESAWEEIGHGGEATATAALRGESLVSTRRTNLVTRAVGNLADQITRGPRALSAVWPFRIASSDHARCAARRFGRGILFFRFSEPSSGGASAMAARRQAALDRIQQLVTDAEGCAFQAGRRYFFLQCATVTPCFIILAKESPGNVLFNWLQRFLPALAAIAAGVSHVFRWREDSVRYTNLAEGIRSQLWRFQTRSGEYFGALDEQALDKLVTRVDDLNLQSVAHWSSSQLADAAPAAGVAAPPRGEARA